MQMYQKITRIVPMLLLFAFIISCGEDEEVAREDQLVGDWSLESQEVKNVTANAQGLSLKLDDVPQVRESLDSIEIFPENATLTFEEDKTYAVVAPSVSGNALQGTWMLSEDGETLTITGLDQAAQFLGTNTLSFTIQSFTESSLSLLASVPDIAIPDGIDIPNIPNLGSVTLSGDYELSLKK